MADNPNLSKEANNDVKETLYGGYTRFELELEFVQCLANPMYLNHLATQKFLETPAFINYLDYLQYFTKPEYVKYLSYPGPTLRALELLQQEGFRKDILMPEIVQRTIQAGLNARIGRQA